MHMRKQWVKQIELVRTRAGAHWVRADEQPLADRDLDALIGWTLNRGA